MKRYTLAWDWIDTAFGPRRELVMTLRVGDRELKAICDSGRADLSLFRLYRKALVHGMHLRLEDEYGRYRERP